MMNPWLTPAAFFALALILRAPFFFVDIVDWDESTFILMGSAWADGELPYLRLWDNKPPLCFAPFALMNALFGRNLVAIRVLGFLFVGTTATCASAICTRLSNQRSGFIAGLACVVLVTFASRGQATMSETLAILPLTAASGLLLFRSHRAIPVFFSGALFSLASLTRLNLAVVALAATIWLCAHQRKTLFAFIGGGLVPLTCVLLPYVVLGRLNIALESIFFAPLVYASFGLGLWSVALLSPFRSLFWWLTAATVLSVLVSGGGSAHYWIQVHPFSAILVGVLLDQALRRMGSAARFVAPGLFVLIPIAGALSDASWPNAVTKMGSVHGRSLELAHYLKEQQVEDGDVLLLADHLAYWWLGIFPPHRMATHPSSLFRSDLVGAATGKTSIQVVQEVLAAQPRFVVREDYVRHLNSVPDAKRVLNDALAKDYAIVHHVQGLRIYERIPNPTRSRIWVLPD